MNLFWPALSFSLGSIFLALGYRATQMKSPGASAALASGLLLLGFGAGNLHRIDPDNRLLYLAIQGGLLLGAVFFLFKSVWDRTRK